MKVCPKCGRVIGFNSYFGAYICEECGWEDVIYTHERIISFSKKTYFKIIKYKGSNLPNKCKFVRETN